MLKKKENDWIMDTNEFCLRTHLWNPWKRLWKCPIDTSESWLRTNLWNPWQLLKAEPLRIEQKGMTFDHDFCYFILQFPGNKGKRINKFLVKRLRLPLRKYIKQRLKISRFTSLPMQCKKRKLTHCYGCSNKIFYNTLSHLFVYLYSFVTHWLI